MDEILSRVASDAGQEQTQHLCQGGQDFEEGTYNFEQGSYYVTSPCINHLPEFSTDHQNCFMVQKDRTIDIHSFIQWEYVKVTNQTYQGGTLRDTEGNCLAKDMSVQPCCDSLEQTWIIEKMTEDAYTIRASCTTKHLTKYVNEHTMETQAIVGFNFQHFDLQCEDSNPTIEKQQMFKI